MEQLAGKKVCVLLSGGLDSCVLTALARRNSHEVFPVYIRSGLNWEEAELHWLQRFLVNSGGSGILPLKILDLPVNDVYGSHWSLTGGQVPDHASQDSEVYLPARNLLLLSKTALFCALNHIPLVLIGTLKGNPFSDSTPQFFSRFSELAKLALGVPIRIVTPFVSLSKEAVISMGKDLPLHLSFSCIAPVGLMHCGRCNKCAERRRSFQKAGIADQTEYRFLPGL